MPTVPTINAPSIATAALPTVRESTPGSLGVLAQQGGRELSALGGAATRFAGEMFDEATRLQIGKNEASVKDYDAKLMGAIQGVLYGTSNAPDTGFMSARGKNAVDAYDVTTSKLQGLGVELSKDLTNPAQQEMAKNAATLRTQSALVQAAQHRDRENEVWLQTSSKVRVAAAQQGAPLAYSPLTDKAQVMGDDGSPESQSQYQLYLRTIRTETIDQARREGLPDDVAGELVKNNTAKAYAATLGHLIDRKGGAPGDLAVAKKFFAEVKSDLPAEVQDKVRALLETGLKKDQALKLSLEVKSNFSGIGAQEKELDKRFSEDKIDAEVHAMALQSLRADNAQRRAEQGETDKSVLGNIWDFARKGGKMADLSPSQLNYVKTRGLGPSVDSMFSNARSESTIDDAKLFSDLKRMSAENPKAFVDMDLAKYSGQMTRSRWNNLIETQTSINRNDDKAIDVQKVQQGAMKGMRAQMLASGFNLTPKPDSQAAKDLDQFTAGLYDALNLASGDWTAKKLTREQMSEEARKITLGMLKDQALAGTGYFGTSFGQTHKPIWKMKPEERQAPWDIPATERQQITEALKRAGRPSSEDAVQSVYKASQGMR